MSDIYDELRIIARDGGRLDLSDRAKIARAADELEMALRANVELYHAMLEANAHKVALYEQLTETRRKLPPPAEPAWSWSSGWIRLEVG